MTAQRHSWVLPDRQDAQTTACALLFVVSDPGIFPSATDVLLRICSDWILSESAQALHRDCICYASIYDDDDQLANLQYCWHFVSGDLLVASRIH